MKLDNRLCVAADDGSKGTAEQDEIFRERDPALNLLKLRSTKGVQDSRLKGGFIHNMGVTLLAMRVVGPHSRPFCHKQRK
jgi:hypothetical protein